MSPFDVTVLLIIFFAMLISVWLGLVRVVLALVGWSGASAVTAYGFPYVRPFAREWINPGIFADIAAETSQDRYCGLEFTLLQFAADRSAQLQYRQDYVEGEPTRVFPFLLQPEPMPLG